MSSITQPEITEIPEVAELVQTVDATFATNIALVDSIDSRKSPLHREDSVALDVDSGTEQKTRVLISKQVLVDQEGLSRYQNTNGFPQDGEIDIVGSYSNAPHNVNHPLFFKNSFKILPNGTVLKSEAGKPGVPVSAEEARELTTIIKRGVAVNLNALRASAQSRR